MYKLTEDQKKEILRAMADCNLSIQAVKQKLFLHRNTVTYRIEQIKKETGLDARKFYDLMKLLDLFEVKQNA